MNAKLLIVCFYPMLCSLRQTIFQHFGYEVSTAPDFSSAMRLLLSDRYEVVLLSNTVPFSEKQWLSQQAIARGAALVSIYEVGEPLLGADYYVSSWEKPEIVVDAVAAALKSPQAKAA